MLEHETEKLRRETAETAQRIRATLPQLPTPQLANLLENEAAKPSNCVLAEMPISLIIQEAVKRLRASK